MAFDDLIPKRGASSVGSAEARIKVVRVGAHRTLEMQVHLSAPLVERLGWSLPTRVCIACGTGEDLGRVRLQRDTCGPYRLSHLNKGCRTARAATRSIHGTLHPDVWAYDAEVRHAGDLILVLALPAAALRSANRPPTPEEVRQEATRAMARAAKGGS